MKFKTKLGSPHSRNGGFGPGVFFAALIAFLFLVTGGPILAQTSNVQSGPQANGSAQAEVHTPASRLLTDEAGRQVAIPAEVKRVVSLAPNLTEIVFALGKGDQLAGDTDYCDYPPEATRKPHVGGPVNPNFEQIVALKPDLILATSINRHETVDALYHLGLPVYITDPHSVGEMIASVQHIGEALHSQESAEALVKDLRLRLSSLDQRLAGATPSRVLFVVWTDPLISIGRDTFIADALRHAGAQSVVNAAEEWPRINLEEIVRLQPDFLVFASAQAGDTQQQIDVLRSRPGWRELASLRRGNVIVISDAINRPAPRMVDAIEQLARALHPESFSARNDASAGSKQFVIRNPTPDNEEACACGR